MPHDLFRHQHGQVSPFKNKKQTKNQQVKNYFIKTNHYTLIFAAPIKQYAAIPHKRAILDLSTLLKSYFNYCYYYYKLKKKAYRSKRIDPISKY